MRDAPHPILLLLLLPLLSAGASRAHAQEPAAAGAGAPASAATATVPRIEGAQATVDGHLDEPVWKRAARLGDFHQYEPVDGRPAAERTDVLVWYAPDAIWFGIVAHDTRPERIRATKADRDNIDSDDNVVIFLDTFDDRRRAFFFGVNPLGVQSDGVRTEGASSAAHIFGGSTDKSPDYWYESSGEVTDSGYVVEVRIPFKSLRFPGTGAQRWGLQIERKVQRTGFTDTWTDVRRANASYLLQAGTLDGLHDLRRGVVLEAQPFVTASLNGARSDAGAFERGDVKQDAGLNMRLGWTSVSLDATVNPDFSQVEADVGQVTVNERFALFYPEKRPFFLEGIELFSTPNQLVYTRQIASPLAGAKLTGKIGRLGIAYMSALDEPGGGDALFNILRLRRDIGTNSVAGLVFTDRSAQGSPAFNRVAAADTRIVFARLYYFETQLGGSWTRAAAPGAAAGDAAASAGTRGAPIWKAELDRTGRGFGFNYQVSGIGDGFESDAGYVPRVGIVTAHAFNRLTWYGPRGALVESFSTFVAPMRIWRYADFGRAAAIEGNESLRGTFRLRGGWDVQAALERDFVTLDPADYAGLASAGAGGPYVPLHRVSGPSIQVQAATPTYQGFSASAQARRGRVAIFAEGAEGTATTLSGDVALRPAPWARVQLSATWQRITRARDGSRFALSRIPHAKIEIQPSRPLFFRVVAEWRSQRRAALEDARTGAPLLLEGEPVAALSTDALRLDLLASYEPRPGTVVFVGYGSALAGQALLRLGDLERTSDGFFLKVAYRFRR